MAASAQSGDMVMRQVLPLLQELFPELRLTWRPEENASHHPNGLAGAIEVATAMDSPETVTRFYHILAGVLGVLLEKGAQDQSVKELQQLHSENPQQRAEAPQEAFLRDTTQQLELRHPMEQLETLLSQVGVWRFDCQTNAWHVSAAAQEILELPENLFQDVASESDSALPEASISHTALLEILQARRGKAPLLEFLAGIRKRRQVVTAETQWLCAETADASGPPNFDNQGAVYCERRLRWVGIPVVDDAGELIAIHGAVLDVTERENFKRQMQYHVALEEKIARIAQRLIHIPGREITAAIGQALQEIGQYTAVDRAYLFRYETQTQYFHLQDEWHADTIQPLRRLDTPITPQQESWTFTRIFQGEIINVSALDALPPEADLERTQFQARGTRSLLCLPIHINEALAGYVGLETVHYNTYWPDNVTNLLRTFSESLFYALDRPHGAKLRQVHVKYIEQMDRVNQVLLGTSDLDAMLPRLMEEMVAIFRCDRAWLQYPCNPDAAQFEVRAEHTTPNYPGASSHDGILPAQPDVREMLRTILASEAPVAFAPHTGHPLTKNQENWQVRSALIVALKPRLGEPWLFGIHQCDHLRIWTQQEQHLFRDIGLRLIDTLNMLLMHQDLQREGEHFRSVLVANPDLIFIFDRNGRCYDVLPREHPLLMEPVEEILSKTVAERLPEEEAKLSYNFINKVLDEGGVQTFEYQPPRSKANTWISIRAVRFEGGSNPKVLMSCRDITDRKHAEQERRNMEAQIQHAQKLESLGVLAGGIAHDFNNLLMGVLGNADMALSELPSHAPACSYLDDIIKSSQRAAELCRQMLAYSGKGHFIIQPIYLSEIVEEMAHLLEVSISKKAILRYDFAQSLPNIKGDATQIRQVVMNLITNASDAIGDRSGVITIATGAMECDRTYLHSTYLDDQLPDGIYAYIEVSDTGCGMDEETRTRLFEPFYTTKFTGRGLGMSAVLGIVRGHEGAIKCYSEPGRGTTFKVLFPVSDLEEPSREEHGESADEAPQSGTILVIDDEETIRAIARKVLERAGFNVITAADGREGIKVFEQTLQQAAETNSPPDPIGLVLLDMTMPHISGPEVFKRLQALQPALPVILSSGYTAEEVTSQCKGLAGFIQKPYLGSELLEIVTKTLAEAGKHS